MSAENYKALIEIITLERAQELGSTNKNPNTKQLSEAFENVVNSFILDPYDLDIDEINDGVTDGGGDGQIDSMYVIVNGDSLSDKNENKIPDKGPIEVDILIIQSKNTDAFEENPLKLIRTTVADLFNLSQKYSSNLPNYNNRIQEKFALARLALSSSAGRTAKIRVHVFYATKARTANIHSNVLATAQTLKSELSGLAATNDVEVIFLGAEELISMSRQPKTFKRELYAKNLLPSESGDSFACLVSIDSLISFLSDDKGDLVRALFDANVRDFLGKAEVNEAIRSTLMDMGDEDFWWFNNGITIVASAVDQKGFKLVLTEALLVNGLQTSNVLYSFATDPSVSEELKTKRLKQNVLVKIIVPPNEMVRDSIVRATNSQTHIPKPYLKGMGIVHRNIEDHLKSVNLFYERRKNQYHNAGKKRSSIVTLTELSQALMATLLFRGSDARARPNSLLKSNEDYEILFSEKYDLDIFKNIIEAKRLIIRLLIEMYPDRGSAYRNDVIYHILSYLSRKLFYNTQHAASGWRNIKLDEECLKSDIELVVDLFEEGGGTDKLAKSTEFNNNIALCASSARQSSKKIV